MRKNNKNITARTDATNKDPGSTSAGKSMSHRDQKTRPNILRRLNAARFFWSVLKKKKKKSNPEPKIIAEYHKLAAKKKKKRKKRKSLTQS